VTTSRRVRSVRWLGTGAWIGSWYLMYLEITRWHHVKPSLAFNPGPPSATGVPPRPGRPLKILYAAGIAAPLTVAGTLIFDRWRVLGSAEHSLPE
jgi:hypothetical protein